MHHKTGKFILVQKTNGTYQFSLRADSGRAILISNEYSCRESCETGISSVRECSLDEKNFQLLNFTETDFYFKLQDGNGQTIGASDIYKSKLACKQDIIAVHKFAAKAEIESYAVDSLSA